jgi:hypothetical protein
MDVSIEEAATLCSVHLWQAYVNICQFGRNMNKHPQFLQVQIKSVIFSI